MGYSTVFKNKICYNFKNIFCLISPILEKKSKFSWLLLLFEYIFIKIQPNISE